MANKIARIITQYSIKKQIKKMILVINQASNAFIGVGIGIVSRYSKESGNFTLESGLSIMTPSQIPIPVPIPVTRARAVINCLAVTNQER